jgi:hypothetical protein
MKTVLTNFTNDTTLLIQGVKGKVNSEGKIIDDKIENELKFFIQSLNHLINENITETTLN